MSDRTGAIPRQLLRDMCEAGYIKNASPECLQPSSLDLTLSTECYRMRGSYLPRPHETVHDIISHGALYKHNLENPLEVNGTYLIRLHESLALPQGLHALASSKSSTGRINLRTRLLADGVARFDSLPAGYRGELWIEIIPKSFPVKLHPADRLNQLRLFYGDAQLSSLEHTLLYDKYGLLRDTRGARIPATPEIVGRGITLTIDLSSEEIIGYRARPTPNAILNTARYNHNAKDFFEPVAKPHDGELVLQHGSFYILATKEKIIIPPMHAAEMAAYDSTKGEFRSHFAGFFDPGFGLATIEQEKGWVAVLEIATHDHDFILRDAQPICLMTYERMVAKPDILYGADLQSNYTGQSGPRLAKWFAP